MKKITAFICLILLFGITASKAQIISTYAGNGTAGYTGDGGQATAAELNNPAGINCDASGNMYIGDGSNNSIRKVTSAGTISTFAGNGTAGFSGDGGQATAAEIDAPHGLAADASGNIYITDNVNNRIRKVNTSGVISTFAGTGTAGFSGDGGQATAAKINGPTEITFDASGNAYIADASNNRIRKVNTSGVISTFAGNGTAGFSGDGGQATAAELSSPSDVYLDASGNAYLADKNNIRVRKINTSGVISTFAGTGTAGFSGDGGQATAAEIKAPTGVRTDASGNVYIADFNNNRMRKVNGSGIISTFAGNGTAGYTGDGGQATAAEVANPGMMTFDQSGNLYFTERTENIIREVYLSLNVTTSVTANVTCNGLSNGSATVSAANGTTPYTYSWSGGGTSTSNTGLSAGTYTITVTDANSITGTATATITQPTTLSVSATATYSAVCPGKTDTLKSTPSGGTSPYTYNWLPAPIGGMACSTCQNTFVYPFGTTYTVTLTDNNGCTATGSTSITINPFPYVTVTGKENPITTGATDTLTASGGTSYVWSNAATTSSISFTLSAPATYSVVATNSYGCRDSALYNIDTDKVGNGLGSTTPIRIVPNTTFTSYSFSSNDSVQWFYFVPVDSTNQIIATSYALGMPVPHVHRLTLYDSTLNLIEDRNLPDENGASEIRIDVSSLHIGKRYLVRAARTPAHVNAGCSPTPSPTGECHASMEWSFQLAVRDIPLFIPDDSGSESPSMSLLYYENRGQVQDLNKIPRYDIKAYTNNVSPAIYLSDSAVSFVYSSLHSNPSITDSMQRVDMVPAGTSANPWQPLFKTNKNKNAGYLNYFQGLVPNGISNVNGYSRVVYKNIFPLIDEQVYSNNDGAKFYFVCSPLVGAAYGNPANIELQFKGATSVTVTGGGGLNIVTSLGTISFTPGYSYEDSAGHIVPTTWHANFVSVNSTTVKFNTGAYNTNEPLIIRVDQGHPSGVGAGGPGTMAWSTYYGSNQNNIAPNTPFADALFDISTDASGNVYTTGYSANNLFPTLGAIQGGLDALNDAVIIKFSSLDVRQWATYYGGNGYDMASSIEADNSGNVYVTGTTNSTNFPLQPLAGAYNQSILNNNATDVTDSDAFVLKLSSGGTPLWATYYGGSSSNGHTGSEFGTHLALDGLGNLYVVGGGVNPAISTTFPLLSSSGSGSPYNNSTFGTGFILEFTTGGVPEWATRIGGNNAGNPSLDVLNGCAVDANNELVVTGFASDTGYTKGHSLIYPLNSTSCGCGNTANPVFGNAVATKFDKTNNIIWSTYYGGNVYETGNAITTDQGGNVYITGLSFSDETQTGVGIETKQMPYPTYYQGSSGEDAGLEGNAFITEISSGGGLLWGTYFGGAHPTYANAITIDAQNNLFLTGPVTSNANTGNFPLPSPNATGAFISDTIFGKLTGGPCVPSPAPESFIAGFNNAKYVWGTYSGGSYGEGVADYNATDIYVTANNGVTRAAGTCFRPMVLATGPAAPLSWYQNTTNTIGMTPYIGEFSIDKVILAGINEPADSVNGVSIYPNPSSSEVTMQIDLKTYTDVKISLTNLLGETVYTEDLKKQTGVVKKQLSVASLPDATYILKVTTQDKVYCKKMVKLH